MFKKEAAAVTDIPLVDLTVHHKPSDLHDHIAPYPEHADSIRLAA
jgi:hypothetical protein